VARLSNRRLESPPRAPGARAASPFAPILALLFVLLSACSSTRSGPVPAAGTLKTLKDRSLVLPEDPGVPPDSEAAMRAYRDFLQQAAGDPQRPEAMRRLGDLEMESADARAAGASAGTGTAPVPGGGAPAATAAAVPGTTAPAAGEPLPPTASNYQAAVDLYLELLRAYPQSPDNDRVLYQLAHAYEQGGDLEAALRVLDRLVREYPKTRVYDEAQFRRGEIMFTLRNYAGAEQAYATVIRNLERTPFTERSLYMHGWSVYKQGRLDEALVSFFDVLDLKLGGRDESVPLEELPGLSRADRELVEDTLRVTSICLENLQGAETIPAYTTTDLRHRYEYRIYRSLGDTYLSQERVKDAADTFLAFVRRFPLHAQAPVLQARVIDIYQHAGFEALALDAKKEYVERYGPQSEYAQANPGAWTQDARPLVKGFLVELAHRDHALAQKSRKSEDRQLAVHWYRVLIDGFPQEPETAGANFLLAELLYEDGRYAGAAAEYEKTAYHYPAHEKSADAGYAALLAYAKEQDQLPAEQRPAVERTSIDSALQFGTVFAGDARVAAVLTNAAERLYALGDATRAMAVARRVLALQPPATPEQQRVAWTVVGHAAFDGGQFATAEQAYGEVLARTGASDAGRTALVERVAAAVYKQGEQARAAGRLPEAVEHFNRVATVAPQSPVRATAQYDAAAALIELKQWDAAAGTLEDFRRRYPGHPLQAGVGAKLALAYTEGGQWAQAAAEYERLSASASDPALARGSLWQAAELYERAQARAPAVAAYERYVQRFPAPFENAIEARARLLGLARTEGNPARTLARTRELMSAEQQGGSARTPHTRLLGAQAALALAEPVAAEYRSVALVEPLKKQLKLKKARMEDALKSYAVATDYGVAEVTTEATFRTAELYRDFGKALLASQRPKGLSKDELEQYDVLLEEQAFPFEEKATGLHEANARHSAEGIYDKWVKASFEALAALRPVRYGKNERSEEAIDAIR
jgi:TolA-binding protein